MSPLRRDGISPRSLRKLFFYIKSKEWVFSMSWKKNLDNFDEKFTISLKCTMGELATTKTSLRDLKILSNSSRWGRVGTKTLVVRVTKKTFLYACLPFMNLCVYTYKCRLELGVLRDSSIAFKDKQSHKIFKNYIVSNCWLVLNNYLMKYVWKELKRIFFSHIYTLNVHSCAFIFFSISTLNF